MFASHEEKYRLPELDRELSLEDIKKGICSQFFRDFVYRTSYVGEVNGVSISAIVKKMINKACKVVFAADAEDTVGNNTIFDTPYHHHILNRENIRREILRWINKQLTDLGYFPFRTVERG